MRIKSRDLTEGSISSQILAIAFPILLGQIFQDLYNSVDSIIVGNFVGTTALAAVASCSDISHIIISFFTGLSAGSGVLFSRCFGARDYQKLHDAIHTALLFAVLLGIALPVAGIILSPALLRLVHCPADVFPEALLYLRIYLIGVLFTSVYNVAAGVLRAVGDTRSPLNYLIAAGVTNIVLDLVLVCWLGMGVEGVAIATIVSQCLSVILIFSNMLSTCDVYRLMPKDLKIDRKMLVDVLRLGLPAAIQSCLIAFSNLFIQRYVNAFGSSAMAGVGAAKKIDKYVSTVTISIGMATATFVSQNVGAERIDRVRRGVRSALLISFAGCAIIGIPAYFFAPTLIRVFTTDADAIACGVMMVTTIVPLVYAQAVHQVFSNTIRGFGYSTVAMVTTATGMILLRQIYLAIAMHAQYDIRNVFYSFPVGWACTAALSFLFYFFVIRRRTMSVKNGRTHQKAP